MTQPIYRTLDVSMQECIDNCTECHNACTQTVTYCMEMGGARAEAAHLETLLDCAQACATSSDFMLRGSGLHPNVCAVCAAACERCAESCEQFPGDVLIAKCAEACRRAAASCGDMAGMKM